MALNSHILRVAAAERISSELADGVGAEAQDLDPKNWTGESFDLATTQGYAFGPALGTAEQPVELDAKVPDVTR